MTLTSRKFFAQDFEQARWFDNPSQKPDFVSRSIKSGGDFEFSILGGRGSGKNFCNNEVSTTTKETDIMTDIKDTDNRAKDILDQLKSGTYVTGSYLISANWIGDLIIKNNPHRNSAEHGVVVDRELLDTLESLLEFTEANEEQRSSTRAIKRAVASLTEERV